MSATTVTCPRCGRLRPAGEPRCLTCDGATGVTDHDRASKPVQWTLVVLFLAAVAAVVVKLYLDIRNG